MREKVSLTTKKRGPGVLPRIVFEKSVTKLQCCKQNVGVFRDVSKVRIEIEEEIENRFTKILNSNFRILTNSLTKIHTQCFVN
jgi:hypothetical protein